MLAVSIVPATGTPDALTLKTVLFAWCANLASVTPLSAILAVVTLESAILAVVTLESAILAVVTLASVILIAVSYTHLTLPTKRIV